MHELQILRVEEHDSVGAAVNGANPNFGRVSGESLVDIQSLLLLLHVVVRRNGYIRKDLETDSGMTTTASVGAILLDIVLDALVTVDELREDVADMLSLDSRSIVSVSGPGTSLDESLPNCRITWLCDTHLEGTVIVA